MRLLSGSSCSFTFNLCSQFPDLYVSPLFSSILSYISPVSVCPVSLYLSSCQPTAARLSDKILLPWDTFLSFWLRQSFMSICPFFPFPLSLNSFLFHWLPLRCCPSAHSQVLNNVKHQMCYSFCFHHLPLINFAQIFIPKWKELLSVSVMNGFWIQQGVLTVKKVTD